MTDRSYTGLRAALDAGPTPGPWTIGNNGYDVIHGDAKNAPEWSEIAYHGGNLICDCWDDDENGDLNTARFIAASNPEAIRALLADYDRMREALDAAQRSLNTIATLGGSEADFMGTMRQVREYANSRARVARAALAQEQGDSDGSAPA